MIARRKAPKPEPIATPPFQAQTRAARFIHGSLKVIAPQFFPEDRSAAYSAQLDEASRNAEIALEALGEILFARPRHAASVAHVIYDWRTRYHGAQVQTESAERYFVYTENDASIPFVPEEDTHYAYMLPQVAYIASELTRVLKPRVFREVATTFIEMNDLAVETFLRTPTVMPRFIDHERLTLHAVQATDAPVNCCPSLHIAYSVMLDNLGSVYLRGRSSTAALEAVRYSTLRMINSVLYTKQHALIDVSFGMLCAEVVFRKHFGTPFDVRRDALTSLGAQHPIRYEIILDAYDELRARFFTERHTRIEPLVTQYLKEHGYPLVPADMDLRSVYFDTRTRSTRRTS